MPLFECLQLFPLESAVPNVGMGALNTQTLQLAHALIVWWELSGRRDLTQKPWMFTPGGRWPTAAEDLDPYGIWIAEVMRCPPE